MQFVFIEIRPGSRDAGQENPNEGGKEALLDPVPVDEWAKGTHAVTALKSDTKSFQANPAGVL